MHHLCDCGVRVRTPVCNSDCSSAPGIKNGRKPGTCQNEALGKKLCLRKQGNHVPALDPRRKRNEAIPAENLREQGPAEAALREPAKQGEKKNQCKPSSGNRIILDERGIFYFYFYFFGFLPESVTGWPFIYFIFYLFLYINSLFFLLRKKEGGSIWIFISGDELPCLESAFLLVRVCLLLEQAAAKKGIKWTTIKSDCDSLVLNGLLVHRESFALASTWHLEQFHKRGDLPHLLVGDYRGPHLVLATTEAFTRE